MIIGILAICVGLLCVAEGWWVADIASTSGSRQVAKLVLIASGIFYLLGGMLIAAGGILVSRFIM